MFSEEGQISTGAGREGLCREVGGTGDFAVAQQKKGFMSWHWEDRRRNVQGLFGIGVQEVRAELGLQGFLNMSKVHNDKSPGFKAGSESSAESWVQTDGGLGISPALIHGGKEV